MLKSTKNQTLIEFVDLPGSRKSPGNVGSSFNQSKPQICVKTLDFRPSLLFAVPSLMQHQMAMEKMGNRA